ncbi:MAG: hypothetical protein JWM86_441 [Thermoleophilia bacterium]|nr:hypothetical protein [Thermoleophilia bacterium]
MRIGGSIFLIALGAILAFAVQFDSTPVGGMNVDWDVVGVILMVVGALGVLWSLVLVSALNDRNRTTNATYVDDRPVDEVVERRRVR